MYWRPPIFIPQDNSVTEMGRHRIRQDGVVPILQTEEGAGSGLAPSLLWRYTQKPVGKEKTRKNAMGFAGGGAGRRDSGVRRVDDYRGTYETVGE